MKTNKKLSRGNHLAYKYLKQTNKAIMHLNALGFEVLAIEFQHIKPRIEISVEQSLGVAKALIQAKKAMWYAFGTSEELGKWRGYYTMIEGIRCYWKAKEELINP